MNSEANCEIALRYFFAIKQIGWKTLSDKLDRPAYLQLFGEGVFKGPQYAYMFCLEFSCKGFLYN